MVEAHWTQTSSAGRPGKTQLKTEQTGKEGYESHSLSRLGAV